MSVFKKKLLPYCGVCDKDVDYVIKKETHETTFKGITFSYVEICAYCRNCGERVAPIEIEKENYLLFSDAYRKAANLLTSEEIIKIRRNLKLSQTGFAKLIGCGEKNIARYENGAIQTESVDKLMRLCDPIYLEQFKQLILSKR